MPHTNAQFFQQSYRSHVIRGKVHAYWTRKFSREAVLKSIFKEEKSKIETRLKLRLQFRKKLFSRYHAANTQ